MRFNVLMMSGGITKNRQSAPYWSVIVLKPNQAYSLGALINE